MSTEPSPYKGLRPYEEQDRNNFFGRNADCRILVDKILANRLTLLFAAAGVGKSSLLQAKVLSQIKDPQQENLDAVYYRDWVSSPLPSLKQQILKTLKERGRLEGDAFGEGTKDVSLRDFFSLCTLVIRQPLVIALDQFEEFFHNQRHTADFNPFIQQLSAAVNDHTVPIAIIISMREDFALELNDFKPFIPSLFENYYRLKRLNRDSAREAIEEPVKRIGFRYEPKLLDKLLGELVWSEQSDFLIESFNSELEDMVDPVALQIVCSQLWDIEKNSQDKTFHLKTYEAKGGAEAFFRTYLEDIFKDFSSDKKYLAYEVFAHLITRRGAKIAFTLNSLAKILPNTDKKLLQEMLDDLQEKRILRSQLRKEEIWYEIYHDRFFNAIEKWNESYRQERAKELSRFMKDFFSRMTELPGQEKRLAALALECLTADRCPPEGYTASELATELDEDSTELARVLTRLEDMHVLRKQPRDQRFLLYDDFFSSPIKQWNRNYDLERQRIKKNRRIYLFGITIIIVALAVVIRDLYVNFTSYYFHLSIRRGLSDNIEIHRGKLNSLDLFNQRHKYMAETDYRRSQIEPAMQFTEKAINNYQQLNSELFANLQPIEKIEAYWEDGQTDKAYRSVEEAIGRYPERKRAVIDKLASFRSSETFDKLNWYLHSDDSGYKDMHDKIVNVMTLIPNSKALDIILLDVVNNDRNPPNVRAAGVQALERISHTDFGAAKIAEIKSSLTRLLTKQSPEAKAEDEKVDLKLAAARTLGRLRDRSAIQTLKSLASNKNQPPLTRREPVEILGGILNKDVVDFMLQQAECEGNSFLQRNAVDFLGQMGGDNVVRTLTELTKNSSANIRQSAVESLGQTGSSSAVQPLIDRISTEQVGEGQDRTLNEDEPKVLQCIAEADCSVESSARTQEDEPDVVRSIAKALGQLRDERAFQPLLQNVLLVEDDPSTVRFAAESLGRIGNAETYQLLIDTLDRLKSEPDSSKRKKIIDVLGQSGDTHAIIPLKILMEDKNEKNDIRWSAAEALGRLGEPAVVKTLTDLLNTGKGRARLNAVSALGQLGHRDALGPLNKLLKDIDPQDTIYLGLLEALGQLGDAGVLDDLTAWLQKGDSLMLQGNLETMIGSSGAKTIERVIAMQTGEEGFVRQTAVEALGEFESIRPVDLLITRLDDGSVFVRRGAVRALGRLGKQAVWAVEPLIVHLNDTDSGVRQYAAEALGDVGDRRAILPLIASLQDGNGDVRREAAVALGRFGDKRALEPLLNRFNKEEDKPKDGVEEVRRAALLAYAKIGLQSDWQRTTDRISAVLRDESENDRVRVAAAVALLALRSPDPPNDEVQGWLENYASSSQASHRRELAEMLGEFPTEVGTQWLLKRLLNDNNLDVKASVLTALGRARAEKALPELYRQLDDPNPNFKLQKAAAEALAEIASVDSINILAEVISDPNNPNIGIPTRLAALDGLYRIAASGNTEAGDRERAIAAMLAAVQKDEAILGIRTYNRLGDLQARQALAQLQKRLRQEESIQHKVRTKRAELDKMDAIEEQTRQLREGLKEEKSKPYLAFELAYNIARIDPKEEGIELLSHTLADVRNGAWIGIGQVGTVELLKSLHEKWQHSQDPLCRHAAYRAIDNILIHLEAKADKKDLADLNEWYPEVKGEEGVGTRVEWTIARLKENNS